MASMCLAKQTFMTCMFFVGSIAIGVLFAEASRTHEFLVIVEWFRSIGVWGSLLYAVVFALAVVICCPSTVFEIVAGYVFGFLGGIAVAMTGKMLGCCLSFFFGRYMCKQSVQRHLNQKYALFRALQHMIKHQQMYVLMLTRASFLPISLKNYGLSVLEVSFYNFFIAAFATGIAYSILWTYLGHAAKHLQSLLDGSDTKDKMFEISALVIGALSAFALIMTIGYQARKQMLQMAELDLKQMEHDSAPLEEVEAQSVNIDEITNYFHNDHHHKRDNLSHF